MKTIAEKFEQASKTETYNLISAMASAVCKEIDENCVDGIEKWVFNDDSVLMGDKEDTFWCKEKEPGNLYVCDAFAMIDRIDYQLNKAREMQRRKNLIEKFSIKCFEDVLEGGLVCAWCKKEIPEPTGQLTYCDSCKK
jgi:hypothetical protein